MTPEKRSKKYIQKVIGLLFYMYNFPNIILSQINKIIQVLCR